MFPRRTTTYGQGGGQYPSGYQPGVCAYEGQLDNNGNRHGWGRMQFADGNVYEGEWNEGKMHGRGTYVFSDGNRYEGEFENGISTMMKHGKGKLTYTTGDVYQGDFEKGERNGFGRMNYANGNVYEGGWNDGKHHGKGTAMYPKIYEPGGQDVYEGDWINGQRHGWGTCKYANGDVYVGSFDNGKKHGKGTFEYANGNVYQGEFKNGKAHGQGTMKYTGGELYEGEFEAEQRHGKGKMKYGDGREYNGDWKCGNAYGTGRFKWTNGDEYDGGFKEGKFHGRGLMKYGKGGSSDFIYDNGIFVSNEIHTAIFYTKLLALNDTGLEIYESILELPPLVEDVHMMKFLYTLIATCRRMDLLKEEQAIDLIEMGLEKTSETITHEDALVVFMLILEKADNDKLVTRANYYRFANRGELKRIEHAPFIQSMMQAIQVNLSQAQRIQDLEENVQIINDSVNAVKAGLKRKLRVEAAVGFMSCVLNTISLGVGGSLLSAAQKGAMDSIIDFGDQAHILSTVEKMSGPESEICKLMLNEGKNFVVDKMKNDKLEAAIRDHHVLVVVAAASQMVSDRDRGTGESGKTDSSNIPNGKVNKKEEHIAHQAKVGDAALEDGNFAEAIYNTNTNGSYPPATARVEDNSPQQQDGLGEGSASGTESHVEVTVWLLSMLPCLTEKDLAKYCECLVIDGYYSGDVLELLEEDDLDFMKKAHRKALVKKMTHGRE